MKDSEDIFKVISEYERREAELKLNITQLKELNATLRKAN